MSNLLPHQSRVVTEKEELDDKISKLTPFLDSPLFSSLDDSEQSRLKEQLSIMSRYSEILGSRIDNF